MIPKEKYYVNLGRASDLEDKKERAIYRAFEIFPGFLVWMTFAAMVFFSWFRPIWAAYFIICFCVYWLLRSLHLSLHIVFAYRQMKKNLETDWVKKLNRLFEKKPEKDWKKIYHLIVFPMYKEDLALIRSSFKALLESKYPKEKMIVVLAIEEKAGRDGLKIGKAALEEFGNKFYKVLATVHPKNIPGEIAGKGANSSWGAKEAKEKIIDPALIPYENIIVSCFDADTRVYPHYFSCLAYHYLTCRKPTRSSFQPVPLFLNNLLEAPFFSRIISSCDVFWQMMQQQRPEKINTYSSHSMAFKALVEMDFWQKNVVSEDSGIFWKAFLFYDGDYRIIPLHYILCLDSCLGKNLWQTIANLYRQQRRWASGSEGIPFLLFGFLKNKKILFKDKFRYSFLMIESFWAWGTNALLILFLGWLPLALGGREFSATLLSYSLPRVTSTLMTVSMFGLFVLVFINSRILLFHPTFFSRREKAAMVFQWIFLPFILIFFGSFPSIDAQTRLMFGKRMGFWTTPKIRKSDLLEKKEK